MSKDSTDKKSTRRDFIHVAASAAGAVGVGCVAWPLIHQMNPDASVKALSSVEVDLSKLKEGQDMTVMWRGKPVFIRRRTKDEVAKARSVSLKDLKDPQKDEARVKKGKEEWLIMLGVCTHLGCVPLSQQGEYGGWFCPCHGSHYDISGRIRKGPAPNNLEIPKYEFVSDTKVVIG
jgi:ubiquinol-cytochrome c reductase iron-sulfur subunit